MNYAYLFIFNLKYELCVQKLSFTQKYYITFLIFIDICIQASSSLQLLAGVGILISINSASLKFRFQLSVRYLTSYLASYIC